jgi:signal transduction histidine kinase
MDFPSLLHLKDEPSTAVPADADGSERIYAARVNRPLPTALGWRIPNLLLDVGPVAFVVVEGTAAIAVATHAGARTVWLAIALAIVAIALLLRHRAPLRVLAVVLVVLFVVDYGPVGVLPALLAVFNVAEYCDRSRVMLASFVTGLAIVLAPVADGVSMSPQTVVSRFVAVGLAVSLGLYLRARADFVVGLHERAERLERERELLAQQAVSEERLRIARELHDVVAHSVSLMVVQSQALAVGDSSPQQQRGLGQIAGLGREALSEMHRMLGVLRIQDGADPDRKPQPGVRDLGTLVERTRSAGLQTELVVHGEPRDLPPGIDLSAYRIVQEALTNVLRHARASRAIVTLAYAPDLLDVTVEDNGIGVTNGGGSGHGLVGMRERVALFGGRLDTTPGRTGRGYQVHAVLPVH